ncbi:MAG: UDP-N-acetylmuramoyl-L-alanine--D-glutamate ligase [Candidatus Krumholzibacteriota bacterium]|nr:UDP-N-acetylmuramoyl-L-alanine--D-glutamate ligase [Candidatus Krumholzibacteriota bacterium]
MSYETRKKVLVLGLARSGQAALHLLACKGLDSRGADDSELVTLSEELKEIEIFKGDHQPEELLDGVGEIVISPGITENHPVIKEASGMNIPVIGELELAFRFAEAPVIAVTGTNGKSTTVSMIGEILKEDGRDVIVAGNTGTPFSSVVMKLGPKGIFVIEVSSFQLETIKEFHPVSAGILNLTPDHLDRYENVEDYYRMKERILENSGIGDLYFYNADDPLCVSIAEDYRGRLAPFSSRKAVEGGVFLDSDRIVRSVDGNREEIIIEKNDLGVIGLHNIENAMAAIASLQGENVSRDACNRALRSFRGLRHRMEKIAESGGVTYYNDSKATNVEAAVKSLTGLPRPVVLIAGGYDKGSDYSKFREVLSGIRMIVTIGKAAVLIENALKGMVEIKKADSMEDAVRKASDAALDGDFVILSPACASFDMFSDFENRGDVFRDCVLNLGRNNR